MKNNDFTINRDRLEITTRRVFNSTQEKLFTAYTTASQILQWWTAPPSSLVIDKLDLRIGGTWRFVESGPDHEPYAWSGIYQDIDTPRKIITTFVFEPIPGQVHIGTILFNNLNDGSTELTESFKFMNIEDLDRLVAMGMEQQRTALLDRIAAIVE